MQYEALEEVKNPYQWAYHQYEYGKIDRTTASALKRFSVQAQKYNIQQQITQLIKTCKMTNHIAVSAARISNHHRRKIEGSPLRIGNSYYYMFHRDMVPLAVYSSITMRDDEYIYE